jgi:hypothetical protein
LISFDAAFRAYLTALFAHKLLFIHLGEALFFLLLSSWLNTLSRSLRSRWVKAENDDFLSFFYIFFAFPPGFGKKKTERSNNNNRNQR